MHDLGFTIDEEFASRLPGLTAFELDQLRQNIINDQMIREPLVIWEEESVLVDGHNRLAIYDDLEEAEILDPPDLIFRSFADRDEVLHYIDCNAVGKRNLDPDNERIIRGRIYNHRKKQHGGDRKTEESKPQDGDLKSTSEVVAQELGVSKNTVERDGQRAEVYDAVADTDLVLAEAVKSAPQSVVSEIVSTAKECDGEREEALAEAAERVVSRPKPVRKYPLSTGFTKVLKDIVAALMLIREDHGTFKKMVRHKDWDKRETSITKQLMDSVIQSLEEIRDGA